MARLQMRASLDHEFGEDWVGVCEFVGEGVVGKRHRGVTYRYHLECTAGLSRLGTQVANLIKAEESLKRANPRRQESTFMQLNIDHSSTGVVE